MKIHVEAIRRLYVFWKDSSLDVTKDFKLNNKCKF